MYACACLLVSQQGGVRSVRWDAGPCISRKTSKWPNPHLRPCSGAPGGGEQTRGGAPIFICIPYSPKCVCRSPWQPLGRPQASPPPTQASRRPVSKSPTQAGSPRGIPNPSAGGELRSSWRGTRRGPLVTSKERTDMLGATRAGPGSWQSRTDFQVPSRPPKPRLPLPPCSPGPARREKDAARACSEAHLASHRSSARDGPKRAGREESPAERPEKPAPRTPRRTAPGLTSRLVLRLSPSAMVPRSTSRFGSAGHTPETDGQRAAPPRRGPIYPGFPSRQPPRRSLPIGPFERQLMGSGANRCPAHGLKSRSKARQAHRGEGAGTPGSQSARRWAGLRRSGPVGAGRLRQTG